MTLAYIRLSVKYLSFLLFVYGGNFKIYLGSSIPCLSCPFVGSCGGGCYLMALQRASGWLFVPLFHLVLGEGSLGTVLNAFSYFLQGFGVFVLLIVLLGKSWCGFICPFGLFQDWLSTLRKLFGISELTISPDSKKIISAFKYLFLIYLLLLPALSGLGVLSRDFGLAFCNICPAKIVMPLFSLDINRLSLPSQPWSARDVYQAILLSFLGFLIAAMFFKERFFCLMCPMLGAINLLRPFHLLRLEKEPGACLGCGNCKRTCGQDNQSIYHVKKGKKIYDPDCLGCFKCAEGCSGEGSLKIRLGPLTLFGSSPSYSLKLLSKRKP
jgi:polyferredoxin